MKRKQNIFFLLGLLILGGCPVPAEENRAEREYREARELRERQDKSEERKRLEEEEEVRRHKEAEQAKARREDRRFSGGIFYHNSFNYDNFARKRFAEDLSRRGYAEERVEERDRRAEDRYFEDFDRARRKEYELRQVTGAGLHDKFGPIHELAGDWVPDSIDLAANGGFSIAPFNGSPVPYNLNGWVDAERGKP